MRRLLLLPWLLALAGCGASTVRLEMAPTVDTGGHPGFEALLSLGIGMPLDFKGRSHHFMQARAGVGGGVEGESASRGGTVLAAVDVDYIYWAEPRLDLRAGMRLSYRGTPDAKLYGVGARLGLLPIVLGDDGNWLISHFCLGPELRVESLWNNATGEQRGLFALPLVAEINLLAAGD